MSYDLIDELRLQAYRFYVGKTPGNDPYWKAIPDRDFPDQWENHDCPRCKTAFSVERVRLWGYRCTKCGHVPRGSTKHQRKEVDP